MVNVFLRERAFQERKIELVRTEQTLLIVQRLALAGATSEVARLAVQQLIRTPDSS